VSPEKVSAIILAAGESKRMQAFKPLLTLGRMTVVERAIHLFKSAGIDDVLVVIGHRAHELAALLAEWGVKHVVNEFHREGMFSSVVCGIGHLQPDHDAFYVLPVDIPLVRKETVLDLLGAYRTSGKSIIHPTFHGKRGHPPLIAYRLAPGILHWSGEGGLRAFLRLHEPHSLDVDVADEGVLLDLDTDADYRELLDRFGPEG